MTPHRLDSHEINCTRGNYLRLVRLECLAAVMLQPVVIGFHHSMLHGCPARMLALLARGSAAQRGIQNLPSAFITACSLRLCAWMPQQLTRHVEGFHRKFYLGGCIGSSHPHMSWRASLWQKAHPNHHAHRTHGVKKEQQSSLHHARVAKVPDFYTSMCCLS